MQNAGTILDCDETSYLTMKLFPRNTGLPMAVWITNNNNYPHDIRIKVSLLGGEGTWSDAVPVSLRPIKDITGKLTATDFKLVQAWLDLNRETIIDYWNDDLDGIETGLKLRKI